MFETLGPGNVSHDLFETREMGVVVYVKVDILGDKALKALQDQDMDRFNFRTMVYQEKVSDTLTELVKKTDMFAIPQKPEWTSPYVPAAQAGWRQREFDL